MPKYEVLEKSLIGNELFEAGAIVEYDGLPAENLKPLDAEGEAKAEEYRQSNAERIAAMQAANPDSAVGNPNDFAKALATAMSENNAAQAGVIAVAVAEAVKAAFAAFNTIAASAPAVEAAPTKTKTADSKSLV